MNHHYPNQTQPFGGALNPCGQLGRSDQFGEAERRKAQEAEKRQAEYAAQCGGLAGAMASTEPNTHTKADEMLAHLAEVERVAKVMGCLLYGGGCTETVPGRFDQDQPGAEELRPMQSLDGKVLDACVRLERLAGFLHDVAGKLGRY